jgi:hypothetical protein
MSISDASPALLYLTICLGLHVQISEIVSIFLNRKENRLTNFTLHMPLLESIYVLGKCNTSIPLWIKVSNYTQLLVVDRGDAGMSYCRVCLEICGKSHLG